MASFGRWLICFLFFQSSAVFGQLTGQDLDLAEEYGKSDLVIELELAVRDHKLLGAEKGPLARGILLNSFVSPEHCEPEQEDGSSLCWNHCSREGYNSSTCAGRCGTTTNAGSRACWQKCGKEGYSSSTCSSRCGIRTDWGSESCWNHCSKEGYSSSTCANRCGTVTDGGKRACWKKCGKEGYSSSTCSSRCGI